jgi:hypothetical protein
MNKIGLPPNKFVANNNNNNNINNTNNNNFNGLAK